MNWEAAYKKAWKWVQSGDKRVYEDPHATDIIIDRGLYGERTFKMLRVEAYNEVRSDIYGGKHRGPVKIGLEYHLGKTHYTCATCDPEAAAAEAAVTKHYNGHLWRGCTRCVGTKEFGAKPADNMSCEFHIFWNMPRDKSRWEIVFAKQITKFESTLRKWQGEMPWDIASGPVSAELALSAKREHLKGQLTKALEALS